MLLDRSTYSAVEIWQASREDVRDRLEAPGSRARNERNSMGITQFISIARRVWPEQNPPRTSTRAPIVESAQAKEMTRRHAIHYASHHCSSGSIQEANTRFANINAGKDVWWIDIPLEMITAPRLTLLNMLLCDGRSRWQQLRHLQIPISYLQQQIQDFRLRDKNKIHLELSTAEVRLFQDVVGPGRIQFAQFRHCDINVSNRS